MLFDVEFFATEAERKSSQKRVLWLLQALTNINRLYLQEHPETPLIYKSGIKYKVPEQFERADVPELGVLERYIADNKAPDRVKAALKSIAGQVGGGEHFRDIPRIIENGGGDCDNVASWRAAELCEMGVPARPYITWRERADGGTTYHVIVMFDDGTSEDPSLLLGMGGAARAADRKEEERKMGERLGDFIAGYSRGKRSAKSDTIFGAAIYTPQNYNQLQYTLPFQNDDAYEDWSPTRPQGYYANPFFPNLPSTSGGMPIFNTRIRDVDDLDDFDRSDRFDGDGSAYAQVLRAMQRGM